MRRMIYLTAVIGGLLSVYAGSNSDTNQSLIMADQTCQRIVVNGTGDAKKSKPLFEDVMASVEYSKVNIDDHFLGKGADASSTVLTLSGTYAEKWQMYAMAGHDRYRWDGDNFRLEGNFVELATTVETVYGIQVGPFVEMADVNTELKKATGGGTIWAAGLLASKQYQVDDLTIGLSTALASMNKRTFEQILEKQDSAWAAMADLRYPLGQYFAVTGYGYYYTLIENSRPTDGSYWLFGGELEFRPTEQWIATVGWSKTAANTDYDADTLLLSLAYQF